MTLAICPGSFDPITNGHIDIIERAASIFDEVIVAVATNAAKKYLFDDPQRFQLTQESLAYLPNVRVELVSGLIADFASACSANAIVKGIRGGGDFFNEESMGLLNRHLGGIETVFVMANPGLAHIASSYVKEIAAYRGSIDKLVPENVASAVLAKISAHGFQRS
ncbi:pantetheine-phosphate adenylyltransferase [Arcanobacterium hippocoleae]|uniref:pantetheine-phosphate adenylyltransferase n=1 Tax=Arcanobacterium hippocoleae TaxID=149017 RepID=UPI003340EDB3